MDGSWEKGAVDKSSQTAFGLEPSYSAEWAKLIRETNVASKKAIIVIKSSRIGQEMGITDSCSEGREIKIV